jgi:hypothetical protein
LKNGFNRFAFFVVATAGSSGEVNERGVFPIHPEILAAVAGVRPLACLKHEHIAMVAGHRGGMRKDKFDNLLGETGVGDDGARHPMLL